VAVSGCGQQRIKLWDAATGLRVCDLTLGAAGGHRTYATALSFCQKGDLVVAGCRDGGLHTLDTRARSHQRRLNGASAQPAVQATAAQAVEEDRVSSSSFWLPEQSACISAFADDERPDLLTAGFHGGTVLQCDLRFSRSSFKLFQRKLFRPNSSCRLDALAFHSRADLFAT